MTTPFQDRQNRIDEIERIVARLVELSGHAESSELTNMISELEVKHLAVAAKYPDDSTGAVDVPYKTHSDAELSSMSAANVWTSRSATSTPDYARMVKRVPA